MLRLHCRLLTFVHDTARQITRVHLGEGRGNLGREHGRIEVDQSILWNGLHLDLLAGYLLKRAVHILRGVGIGAVQLEDVGAGGQRGACGEEFGRTSGPDVFDGDLQSLVKMCV